MYLPKTAISVSDCTVRERSGGGGSMQGSFTKVLPPRPWSCRPGCGFEPGPSLDTGPKRAISAPAERPSPVSGCFRSFRVSVPSSCAHAVSAKNSRVAAKRSRPLCRLTDASVIQAPEGFSLKETLRVKDWTSDLHSKGTPPCTLQLHG